MPSLQMDGQEAVGQDSQESLGPRELALSRKGTALNGGRSRGRSSKRRPRAVSPKRKQGKELSKSVMEAFLTILIKETEARRGWQWALRAIPAAASPWCSASGI